MSIESGRVDLTEVERESIALALSDALTPYGRAFHPEDAARLLEARLSVLLAARGERGYHEGWKARAGDPREGFGLADDRPELGNPNKPSAERCVAVDAYGLGRCVLDAHASGSHAWEEVQGPPGPPQRWQVSTAEGGA